ncbi:MAG TPA: competence protein ComK [Virgibacillus sp.]|nr:competence protein ComK [Virgibacillus sp.]
MTHIKRDYYSPTYEINPLTMAVLPQHDKEGNTSSHVIEGNEDYFVAFSPSKVIDFACRFFGSSLKGRQEGTKAVSNITHKAPISVAPSSGIYFLPTLSPVNPMCGWIAHSHIKEINRAPEGTEIVFKNGRNVIVEVSFGSMLNQVQRTAQFRYWLENRINYLDRPDFP